MSILLESWAGLTAFRGGVTERSNVPVLKTGGEVLQTAPTSSNLVSSAY